jgi:hypothetical protein
MWIFLNNAFLSIVSNKDDPDNLLVRGRRRGDIRRVFPKVKVVVTPEADYRYRAFVPRTLVAETIASRISAIDYTNFKDSVTEEVRHTAYLAVWRQMFIWQGVMVEKLRPAPSPGVKVEKLRPAPSPGVKVEKLREAPSPPVTAKAGKKPRRWLRRFFGGHGE